MQNMIAGHDLLRHKQCTYFYSAYKNKDADTNKKKQKNNKT